MTAPAPSVSREVRRLALPAIVHSLLQTLVFVVDRVMLGHHGGASLASMQISGTVEWSIWSIFVAFEVGTIARVGRHVGAGDRARAGRAARISLGLAAGIGAVLAVSTPFLLDLLPALAPSASAETLAEARAYLGVTMMASPVVFLAMTSVAVLQASGDTRTPLAIGALANVVHVGLNRVLILGVGAVPALGARGAGTSTALTFALEAALGLFALTSRSRAVTLRALPASDAAVSVGELRELTHIAVPAFVERLLYHIGYVAYVGMIARLGDVAMAANQSLISIESVCFLSGDGFGIAAAALVAQKLGAGEGEQAVRASRIAARDAAAALSVFGLAALAARDVVLPMFSADPAVLATGRAAMPVLAVAQPFMAVGIVLAQSLRGAGRTREVLAVSVVGAIVVRLSATYLFAIVLRLGLVGVWLGSTSDWIVRTLLLAWSFARRPPTNTTSRARTATA